MPSRTALLTRPWRSVTVVTIVAAIVLITGCDGAGSAEDDAAARNPVATDDGGVSNVTFYYAGETPLAGTDAGVLERELGHPAIVVTTPKSDEPGTVQAIHSIDSDESTDGVQPTKAYRYIQFFWAPDDEEYEGINLAANPGWAFCRDGNTPLLGRKTEGGNVKWHFIDTNEKAVRAKFLSILLGLKADGWDGVFFDRGEAATQYAEDAAGRPVWHRKSSCTGDPYEAGARFADSYVNMLGLAQLAGLDAMMNTGKSPFDPVMPLRPNPDDGDCRDRRWSRCSFISDTWNNLDLALNEAATKPKDQMWDRLFAGNNRSERSSAHGRRTVALITTSSLGGAANQTRPNVFYAWSRIKLFNLAVSVNTGDGGCEPTSDADAVCNRYGVYPELVNTVFGKPLGTGPVKDRCARGSDIRCLWTRRYAKGVNVLNASPKRRDSVEVTLGLGTCRHVYDVFRRKPLADNRCVKKVNLTMPAWSGRPLRYKTSRW